MVMTPCCNWTIQTRILLAFWAVLSLFSAAFAYLIYQTQKSEYLDGIDSKLYSGAIMARALVGPTFHDGVNGPYALTKEAYLDIVDAYNKISLTTGYQYLWSNLFLEDGSVVFTSGTSTSKDVTKGDHANFFDVHSDPSAFDPVKRNKQTTYSSFFNKWGNGRMVLVPFKDGHGRTYVFGASISIEELEAKLEETKLISIAIFAAMLVLGTAISMIIAKTIADPIKRLNSVAQQISIGNYGLQAEKIDGGAELVSLSSTINEMSSAIRANYDELSFAVRKLEETQQELQRSRDELEIRVDERTRDLRKLTKVVEQSPHMVMITDLDGRIEYVNPKFTALTGYLPDEAIGQSPRMLQSGDTPKGVYEEMWERLATDGLWTGEIKDRCKDGQVFWASVSISRVTNNEGIPTNYVASHEDITERKLAERSIKIAKDEAEAASKAKSEMLANMSHELRTPLNAIIGFSDMMLSGTLGPVENKKHEEYLADINESALHLLLLINDILDVSAIEAGKIELREKETSVSDIIDASLRLVMPRARDNGVQVHVELSEPLPVLVVDPLRMKQAFLNILSNAVKFTSEGGQITVSTARSEDGGFTISVQDNGIGMTPQEIAIAMEPFGQVDGGLNRRFEGTGLGLPLTKGLIELHGGQLVVESEKGVGTRVCLCLGPSRVVA
jgi:PAS domain S-box-containing protein